MSTKAKTDNVSFTQNAASAEHGASAHKGVFWRLLRYAAPYWHWFAAAVILMDAT